MGERVLLVDAKARRYLITLADGGQFHSHAGITALEDILGQHEGVTVRSTAGARYTVVRPTLADFVLKMPRGAQVVYPKDLGPLLMLADVFPGRQVVGIHAVDLVWGLGTLHCLTQQQPAGREHA